MNISNASNIKVYQIIGSRRFSNYWWASIILLGSLGFFTVGLSSYFKSVLIPFIKIDLLTFVPQGAIMTFYGTIGILTSIFLWYTIVLNVGSGYNEFNNETKIITIFRLGFPGKNRLLKLQYNTNNIASIKILIEEKFFNRREIYLKMKDRREIPLTKVGEPISISELENQAIELAQFLNIKVEGIK
uniref:Photosystem I assembly protein Ycf4 n=1 Tax=Caloglossa monosticha TaxID=76906 RepID=A0A1Z1M5A5_9FLOR|nr:photosystem I assembly protein [Caloglossa monosticha]ARW61021.1 photosystem I assembly protein [Caloglossa monosticha]